MRQVFKGATLALALTAGGVQAEPLAPGTSGPYLAARHAAAQYDFKAAARFYAKALARNPYEERLMEQALAAQVALGATEPAESIAARMLAKGSADQVAQMMDVVRAAQRGSHAELAMSFAGGTRVGPLVDDLLKGWALIGAGDRAAGLAAFDAIAENANLRAFGLHHKALALASFGEYAAAEEIFSGRASGALPDNRRSLIARVSVLSLLGDNETALAEIARVAPGTRDATLLSLSKRLRAGEAVPFTLVESANDGMAEVFYMVSTALDGEAADSFALLYSRVAEALNPDHVDALLMSAEYLERLGRPELATAAYDRVPRDAPEFITAELGRAGALRAANRPDAAVEALTQLAETFPTLASVRTKLGDTLRRMERYEEASEAYTLSLELAPEIRASHWFTFFARGITLERQDRWVEAETDFRRALELNPNQPQVMNYLGYSLVEKDMKLDEALELIEAAAALRPDSGHILDSLGWVLYRLGRFEEAVAPMEQAVELMATDPVINDHLGDVYWSVGRHTEAHFQWLRALSFDPGAEAAERIRRKLDVGLDIVLEEEGLTPIAVANDDG